MVGQAHEGTAERHLRQAMLLGEGSVAALSGSHVAVVGLGGVGSYAVEALARSGVGTLTLVDKDVYSPSNLNRQLYATMETIGMPKVRAAAVRVREIDPMITVYTRQMLVLPDNVGELDFSRFDYVIDAVDTVAAKVALARACADAGVPFLSCMGTGNKTDPTKFTVARIDKTDTCPLARAVRLAAKKAGIPPFKVVYSTELPVVPEERLGDLESGKPVPASCAFVPSVAGLILAGEVIKDLI